jgi:hypothetical protein
MASRLIMLVSLDYFANTIVFEMICDDHYALTH